MNTISLFKRKSKNYIHKKRIDLLQSMFMNKYSLSRTVAASYSKFVFQLETIFERNPQFVFTNDIFYYEGFTHTTCAKCMKFLKDNNIITVHTPLVKNYKYNTIRRDKSTFISLNLNFPEETYSGKYVVFEYKNITPELRTLLSNTPSTSEQEINNYTLKTSNNVKFSEENFCKRYADLTYVNLYGEIDIEETRKLAHPAHHTKNSPHRFYHYFHSIPKELRSRLRLEGEEIVELFDIHNCALLMVNFVLPEPDEYFEKLTLSGKIYETIRDWVNMTYGCNWDREFTKSAANKYLNISNWKLDKAEIYDKSINKDAYYVSQFFKNECPNVYNYIRNTHQCTSKEVYRNFTKELEKNESYIIVDNICKELWNNFSVECISLHDSIWCKKSDFEKFANKYSVKEKIKTLLITKKFK